MKYFISGYGTDGQSTIALIEDQKPLWTSAIPNPSYLCETENLLFAVGEFDDFCTVTSFIKTTDGYQEKDTIRLDGTCLCHLSADPLRHYLAGSCWGNGLFFTISYTKDGMFEKVLYQEYQNDGTDRKSRVHCALILDAWIYVVNIELDFICCYQIVDGIPQECSRLYLPKGTGPRHIYANQEKHLLYCVTEYSSQLLVIDYSNPRNLRLLSSHSLLASDFSGTSTGSSLAVTRDQKHLYAANRGENTIVHFLLDAHGMPVLSERVSCQGDWPRHIALLHEDRFLAIANQYSGDVTFLERNHENGRLASSAAFQISHSHASFVAETH